MSKKTEEFELRCFDCGQNTEETGGLCTRCDELCEHCGHRLREHFVVGIYTLCPTTMFSGTGQLGQK